MNLQKQYSSIWVAKAIYDTETNQIWVETGKKWLGESR
jgi:hypothetical protein